MAGTVKLWLPMSLNGVVSFGQGGSFELLFFQHKIAWKCTHSRFEKQEKSKQNVGAEIVRLREFCQYFHYF